jgi:hypothetical protein
MLNNPNPPPQHYENSNTLQEQKGPLDDVVPTKKGWIVAERYRFLIHGPRVSAEEANAVEEEIRRDIEAVSKYCEENPELDVKTDEGSGRDSDEDEESSLEEGEIRDQSPPPQYAESTKGKNWDKNRREAAKRKANGKLRKRTKKAAANKLESDANASSEPGQTIDDIHRQAFHLGNSSDIKKPAPKEQAVKKAANTPGGEGDSSSSEDEEDESASVRETLSGSDSEDDTKIKSTKTKEPEGKKNEAEKKMAKHQRHKARKLAAKEHEAKDQKDRNWWPRYRKPRNRRLRSRRQWNRKPRNRGL